MAPTRSLNVVVAGDDRGFKRMVQSVDRDSDRLEKRFTVLASAGANVGNSMGNLSLRVGAVGGSLGSMLPVLAGAAPALAAAGAAATALAGSFTAAAAGAGALGAGLAASLAPVALVGKQVTSRFEEITKAYDALKEAQRTGTAEAQKNADALMAGLSKNEQAMVGSLGRLSALQDKVLGGAGDRVIGGLARAVETLAPALGKLERPFDRLGGVIAGSIGRLAELFASGPWQSALKEFVDSASSIVGPITTIFARVSNIIRDVAVASLPLVQDAIRGVADWFTELDRKATTSRIREVVDTLVDHTRSWFELFRQVGGLVSRVLGSAAGEGQGLVDTMTGVVRSINGFIDGLRAGEGAGGRFREIVTNAFNTVRTAVSRVVATVRDWVGKNRGDIDSVIKAFQDVAKFARHVFEDTVVPIVRRSIRAIGPIISGLASTIRGLVRLVSGLLSGDWDKAWSGAKEAVSGAFRVIKTTVVNQLENILEIIKDLGPDVIRLIGRGLRGLGQSLATGLLDGIKWAASNVPRLAAGALKGLGKAIGSAVSSAVGNIFGDGLGSKIGDGVGQIGKSFPAFGGGLMGARPNMAPIAGAASRFGLGVSSGLRPGSITSSGNRSYHSTGEALDIAGSPAGMLGFFRFMKNTMGPRLAELIYTPGGAGIRNGASHTYSGAVAADHYDHVHVAIDSGAPGVGDGIGNLRNGPKGPLPFNTVAAIAERAGLPGVTFAQLAQGESGLDPDNVGHDPGGTKGLGLWQITTGFNDDIIAKHGGVQAMFDPRKNALAARDIFRRQGKGAWFGTSFVKGWDLHFKGSTSTGGSSGGGGGGSSSGPAAMQKAAQGAARTALREQRTLTGPGGGSYEQRLGDIGLGRAQAEGDVKKTTQLVFGEIVEKRRRLAKVRRALKRRLRKETRQRLTEEATQLTADLRELAALVGDLTDASPDADGQADPVDEAAEPPAPPTEGDFVNAAIAEAALTAGTEDDVAAAAWNVRMWEAEQAAAVASGDPVRRAAAATGLKSARDSFDSLTQAINANTEALNGVRADLEKQRADALQRDLNVSQAQYGPLLEGLGEFMNRYLGQRTGSGMQTGSYAGAVANYGSTGRL